MQTFYKNPRFQFGALMLGLGLLMLWLYWPTLVALFGPFLGQGTLGLHTLQEVATLAFAGFIAWATRDLFYRLVSQFTLPVNTDGERRQALEHFFRFTSGLPGSAIFVRDGMEISSADEKARRGFGAGVILVDAVSAVVLRNDTQFTGAHGPGVIFTRPGEYIAAALDLRKQTRTAEQVRALTRDGIETTANLSVVFMLENGRAEPFRAWERDDEAAYDFSEYHALRAVAGSPVREDQAADWRDLPTHYAVEIWRELLLQRDFDTLFSKDPQAPPLLSSLILQVKDRLANRDRKADEYLALQNHGLRVLSVSYSGLSFSDEVRKRLLESWQKEWQSGVGELPEEKDKIIAEARAAGENEARAEVVSQLTQYLRDQLARGGRPPLSEVVINLAARTRALANDPALKPELNTADLQPILLNMEVWANRLRNGHTAPRETL
jgi:hypothetical protein